MSYYIAEGAVVKGQVSLGDGASVWYNATVRGDSEPIEIGKNSNIQDNAVVHVDLSHKVVIGENVTIGHSAIIHGCTIGDNTLIGMGAIILNGAKIGRDCIIGAGALVTQGTEIPDGSLAFGNPAKIRRLLTDQEIADNHRNAMHYVEIAGKSLDKYE